MEGEGEGDGVESREVDRGGPALRLSHPTELGRRDAYLTAAGPGLVPARISFCSSSLSARERLGFRI